ncbi:MAG: transposase, partial [Acinetobacter sp.]
NVCIKTRKNKQLYCNKCQKTFSVRKGTMFYCLHTPMEKIVRLLNMLASGLGVNALCRVEAVTPDSLRAWIILASQQVASFNQYMTQEMHLEQVQIDEFWSFIRKKTVI